MTKTLIVVPDPGNPGVMTPHEYSNLHRVWTDGSSDGANSGILCVQPTTEAETVQAPTCGYRIPGPCIGSSNLPEGAKEE